MQFRRTIFALLCVFGWLSGALHEDLEAADWMPDHHHRGPASHEHEHEHGRGGAHSHDPVDADAEHDPVWARDGARIGVPALIGPLLGLLVFFFLPRDVVTRVTRLWSRFRSREPSLRVIWQFVQRCAAPSAAPPALN